MLPPYSRHLATFDSRRHVLHRSFCRGLPMPSYSLLVNGRRRTVEAAANTPLLWVLRDNLGMTGTKFGCGIAQCGACTVHIDGQAIRSCIMPVSAVGASRITTIEGLSTDSTHRVQKAWVAED